MKRIMSNTEKVWGITAMCAALLVLVAGCAVGPDGGPPDLQDDPTSIFSSQVEFTDFNNPIIPREVMQETKELKWCDQVRFPPANEPDGCFRRMLTMTNAGAPFTTSSTEPTISRNGGLVAFTVLPTMEPGVNGLSSDTNQVRDVYAVDLMLRLHRLQLVSVNNEGTVGDGDSFEPSVSGNGRFVAFTSYAENLTAHQQEGYSGIFVRDRLLKTTKLVSLPSSDELLPNGDSYQPLISADGRYVAFLSRASNLVRSDSNNKVDLFLRDTLRNGTRRLSLDENGQEVTEDALQAVGISENNQFVLFSHPSALTSEPVISDDLEGDERIEAYRLDRLTNKLIPISRRSLGNAARGARAVALSADGSQALLHVQIVREHFPKHAMYLGPSTIIATMGDSRVELTSLDIDPGYPLGMSAGGESIVFSSKSPGHVPNVQLLNNRRTTANAYAFHRVRHETQLLTARNNGSPGVIFRYNEPGVRSLDWVTAGISAAGDRFVFSSIQYSLIYHPALRCDKSRPRLIYVVSCSGAGD